MPDTPDRLTDPADHFPYRVDDALAVAVDAPPMGPNGPDDASVTGQDFLSEDIVQASAAYVDAQAAYIADVTDPGLKADYQHAAGLLVAARAAHRSRRTGQVVTAFPARAPRAGE